MKKRRLHLYTLDVKYVRDLANADNRVMSVSPQQHKENRPFVGIIIIMKQHNYCIPMTSPKPKHNKMKNDLDFSEVTSINLDEYKGLSPEDPQSYRYFMNTHLFDHVNIDKNRTFVPDGLATDPEKACAEYNANIIKQGGIDLQLLGIGRNGHIGFNEPGTVFKKETHCVDLTESTIEANKRFFASEADVPRQAYSLGIKNIMQARKILVIVSGKDKADALYNAVHGEITPAVPASILQLHNDVTIVADADALNNF